MADLLRFVQKFKMAAAAITNCYLYILDHPHGPKPVLKFHVSRVNYFQRYGHLNVLQIWLKKPIPAPKIDVWGGGSSSRPLKGTSLRETASCELSLSCVKIGSAIFARDSML